MPIGTDFSEAEKEKIRRRSGGICECKRVVCDHKARCTSRATEFHHIVSKAKGGQGVASNGEHLCASCHRNTRTHSTG